LTFPSDNINPVLSTELINALSYLSTQLVLEITARRSAIQLAIICKSDQVQLVRRTIFGVTDLADINVLPVPSPTSEVTRVSCVVSRDEQLEVFPLTRIHDFKEVDPLSNILESVTPLTDSQIFSLYIIIRPLDQTKSGELKSRIESFS